MTIKFTTVGESTNEGRVKILVYSKPKVGKTSLIATCPNPIIISAEKGLLSLRANPAARNIPVIEVKNIAEFDEAHNWAISSNEAKKFETICLDSITEIAEICLLEEKEKTRAKTAKGKKENGFEPYQELKDHILGVFRSFRDHAPRHVYFIAQEIYDKDEITGMTMFKPAMPGKRLESAIPYIFDEIFQLVRFTTPEGQSYNGLRTIADNMNTAGDRSGRLDPWEQPDISNIIRKIIG